MPQLHNERYEFHHSPAPECLNSFEKDMNGSSSTLTYDEQIFDQPFLISIFGQKNKTKKPCICLHEKRNIYLGFPHPRERETERRTINYTSPSAADLQPSLERIMAVYVITVGCRVFLCP